MISELEFKQIRKKYQGKYYMNILVGNIMTYRHIIKIMPYNEPSEKDYVIVIGKSIIVSNNDLIQAETEMKHILTVPILETCLSHRISPGEYKRVYAKYVQNDT